MGTKLDNAPQFSLVELDDELSEGGLPPLINSLRSTDAEVLENVCGAIRNLSENDVNKARVVSEGALGWLIPLMRTPSVVVLEQMLMLMWNISINPDNKLHLV